MFNKNASLRSEFEKIEYTKEQIEEVARCSEDIIYFASKYFWAKAPDFEGGESIIPLREYQKRTLKVYVNPGEKRILNLSPRQSGKTTTVSIYILHFILFNDNKHCAVIANRNASAKEVLERIKFAYQRLPLWLQQGLKFDGWNATSIKLANGSIVEVGPTTESSISGKSISLLYIDEVALIPDHLAEAFFDSVLPVVSSSKTAKIIMTSTPKGVNIWHTFWTKAVNGESNYFPIRVHWYEVPQLTPERKEQEIAARGIRYWKQEYECDFLGSSSTLIDAEYLMKMIRRHPVDIRFRSFFSIYERPQKGFQYILGVDSAKGTGLDYSVIQVLKYKNKFDVQQVAVYRNNKISTNDFAQIISEVSRYYNDALIMVENNGVGEGVMNTLFYSLECEQIVNLDPKGLGVLSTRTTKLRANLLLRDMVQNDRLKIVDPFTIEELSKYQEEEGKLNVFSCGEGNDDCVTALIWACYFFDSVYYDGEDVVSVQIKAENRLEENYTNIFYDNGEGASLYSSYHDGQII